jgi:hypothetical protein
MLKAHVLSIGLILAATATQPAKSPKIALSEQQSRALAEEIVKHTPEHVHYVEGTTFAWVLFNRQKEDPTPGVTALVLELLKKRYVVYLSEGEVPQDKMTVDGGLILWDGFRFSFLIRAADSTTVEVSYSDYEAPLAASWQTCKYRWDGSKWLVVSKGDLIVS